VLSYIRIADEPANINQVRIEHTRADALIGCDLVVSSSPKASRTYSRELTRAVMNTAEMATGDFILHRDANLRAGDRLSAIRDNVGDLSAIDANRLAAALVGDTIYANVLLLGFAWQGGLIPISVTALMRAIELNGVKIENNKRAFNWGRIAAADPAWIESMLTEESATKDATLDDLIRRRADFLTDYQNNELANRYTDLVERVRTTEKSCGEGDDLSSAVARSYFKLLSYKDEYEIARLHTQTGFLEAVRQDFGDKAKLRFHLAPPILNAGLDARGRPRKKEFGSWIIPVFRLLARLRGLRGTAFDIFGMTAERRTERALIGEFEATVDAILSNLGPDNLAEAITIAATYMDIRGFGPVKDKAISDVRAQLEKRLGNYLNPVSKAA
jgi:indolepyruvate ferredoxin oxidoreductase